MLNQIRGVAGNFFAKLLLVLLLLSFGVWGIGDMISHRGANSEVASIGSEKITLMEFERALQRETERARNALGSQYTPELLRSLNLPENLLKRMINERLLMLDAKTRGLIPGDSDIANRIRANPAFANSEGDFDKERFTAILRRLGQTEKAYVEQMRAELGSQLIMDSMVSVDIVPEIAIDTIYAALEEQRAATLYTLDSRHVEAATAPQQSDLESYYKDHSDQFAAPEYRRFSYAIISRKEIIKDNSISEDELKKTYQERIEEFKRPEQRVVEQMLFDSEEKAKEASELLKQGKRFEQVAKQSDISNKGNLSLGAVARGHMLEAAQNEVFSLQEGGNTGVISSAFGFHIFHVTKIEPAFTASFDEVGPQLEKEAIQMHFENALSNFTNKVQDMLAGGGTLQETAKELGLSLKTTEVVTKDGLNLSGEKSKSVPKLDKFLEVGFATDEKTESTLIAAGSDSYYLLRTDQVIHAQARPLLEVKDQVLSGWKKEQTFKKMQEIADQLEKDFADDDTRAAAILRYKLASSAVGPIKRSNAKPSDTLPKALLDELFIRKIGSATRAVAMKGDRFGILVVGSIIPADSKRLNDKTLRQTIHKNLENTLQNELIDQYLRNLAAQYRVSVNASVFETIQRSHAEP